MSPLKAVQAFAEAGTDTDQSSQEFRYGWIGPEAAMRHLGVTGHVNNLYHLINEWELPHGRLGRLYRFRRADLDQWLTRHTSTFGRKVR